MTRRSHRKAGAITRQSAELALAVPQVMAHRATRMALAGRQPSASDRREFTRMVAEKQAAFGRSLAAMAMQTLAAQQAFGAALLRSFWLPWAGGALTPAALTARWQGAALGVVAKGLAPVHRTAVANARRLAGTPLRTRR